jgi:hypothetical protein
MELVISLVLTSRGVNFNSVRFLLKKKKIEFFLKKPKPVQTDRFRFGSVWFFRTKTGSNRFGSVFFPVLLGFFGLARFFSGFFRFGSVPDLKNQNRTEPNGTGWFFPNF